MIGTYYCYNLFSKIQSELKLVKFCLCVCVRMDQDRYLLLVSHFTEIAISYSITFSIRNLILFTVKLSQNFLFAQFIPQKTQCVPVNNNNDFRH